MTKKKIDFTEQQAEALAAFLRVLGDPKRLEMLRMLMEREMRVGELAVAVGLSSSSVSQHLFKLNIFPLLERRKVGRTVYYKATSDRVRHIMEVCTRGFDRVDRA